MKSDCKIFLIFGEGETRRVGDRSTYDFFFLVESRMVFVALVIGCLLMVAEGVVAPERGLSNDCLGFLVPLMLPGDDFNGTVAIYK